MTPEILERPQNDRFRGPWPCVSIRGLSVKTTSRNTTIRFSAAILRYEDSSLEPRQLPSSDSALQSTPS